MVGGERNLITTAVSLKWPPGLDQKETSSPIFVLAHCMHSSTVVALVSAKCHPGFGDLLLDRMYIIPAAEGNNNILNW